MGIERVLSSSSTRSRGFRFAVMLMGLAVAASACSSSGGSGGGSRSSGGDVAVGILAPFTGADANFGPNFRFGCLIAAQAINAAGGVNGQKLSCQDFDTRGDPADAVPAARQMLLNSSVKVVIGATSDEASSVAPVLEHAKLPFFSSTGQDEFNTNTSPYFHRVSPPDSEEATAMVAIAHYILHGRRAALVFGNDIGSQTYVQPAVNAVKKAGMQLAINEQIDISGSSFRTEVAKVLAAHPDVVITEAFGAASATFLSEMKQQNGGTLPNIVGTNDSTTPGFWKTVSAAVGGSTLAEHYVADGFYFSFAGPSYAAYTTALNAAKASNSQLSSLATNPHEILNYDAVVLAALAMSAAHTTAGDKYVSYIKSIANGGSGAVDVHSYADGVAALKAGKTIHYVGAGGSVQFNEHNNNINSTYQELTFEPSGAVKQGPIIPAGNIEALK